MSAWLSRRAEGVRIAVRLTPGAARDEVGGIAADAAGHEHLAVRVTAPPEKGRANDALRRLLARRWRVATSALTVIGGATARTKVLVVDGDPETLSTLIRMHEEREGR